MAINLGIAQTSLVQGIVTDSASARPLEGANAALQILPVEEEGRIRGIATDDNGFYQITGISAGTYLFQISFVGYLTFKDTLIVEEGEIRTVSVALKPDEEQLDEVVVSPTRGAARLEAGRQEISSVEIQRVPSPSGSGDLASYLQAMPGVVALGDRGGQFYIRGGTPTENMVLIDGTLIFQPFHILGFFSVFPSDLVSEVDFYAGGFGPRYSGRISSVLDVKMRDGNRYQPSGNATVSPFVGELLVEGPLKQGKSSFIASARRSLIEFTSPWFLEQKQPVEFESQYLKLSHFGVNDTRCSGMALRTFDRGQLDFEQEEVTEWKNFLLGGRCVVLPNDTDLLFDLNTGFSHVSNAVGSINDPERFSWITRFNLDANITRYIRQTRLNYGLFVHIKTLKYDFKDQFQIPQQASDHLLNGGVYMEATIPLGEQVHFYPGSVFTLYRENYRTGLEPRFRVSWHPPALEDAQLNLALGRYTQSLVGLSDTRDASSVFTAWMAAPIGKAKKESIHALLGWSQSLGSGFQISFEGYHKWLRNIPVAVWSTLAEFTTDLALADGRVYGSDIRLEYNRRTFYSFLGYGYSWTQYEAAQDHFNVWFGEPVQRYHPSHDRRHNVNGLVSVNFGDYTASLRWEFGTGVPFTRPIGFDEIFFYNERLPDLQRVFGTSRVILEKPYQGRTPSYHRLDISLERIFRFNSADLTLQIGAINLYDHNNLFYYDVYTHRRIDQLPLAPYLSVKLGYN
ncbi:TonB-dependent receptor [Aliifodinibius sp. S!AR15-10]|uniref:TonB-dependent receptor n=1 Tax=Aliifodinibius sp. S!AR15-10 TaxID=2950437 RepID=UPI0028703F2C|nr:TonB-dependent receptor [Aliifodinibius sp. S!AR15-10]